MATKLKVNYEFVGDSTTPVTRTSSIKHGDSMLDTTLDSKADKSYVFSEILNNKSVISDAVGAKQNSQEQTYTYPNFINFGEPNEPPVLSNIPYKGFDIIAHWYNDFGLKSTAMDPNQSHGSYCWYDWSWNFTSRSDYDAKRHPLLGWYQGDDRKTLDWILYWLGTSGINTICPCFTGGTDITGWENESSGNHWFYVLMNQCKNINSFKIMPWFLADFGQTVEQYNTAFTKLKNFVTLYKDRLHTYSYNNKIYATVFGWEGEGIRWSLDGNTGNLDETKKYLKKIADMFKENGFDGACFIIRHSGMVGNIKYQNVNDGYIVYSGEYSGFGTATTYSEYANTSETINEFTVPNIMTSCESHYPHPSDWKCSGSTHKLFGLKMNNTISQMIKANAPNMITIYNVSEWAEGGAGLIPNMADGMGYLDAVASCISITPTKNEPKSIPVIKYKDFENLSQNADNLIPISELTAMNEIFSVRSIGNTYASFLPVYNIYNNWYAIPLNPDGGVQTGGTYSIRVTYIDYS